jgi:hypothetical protein
VKIDPRPLNALVTREERASKSFIGWRAVQIFCILAALAPFLLPPVPVGTDLIKHLLAARVLANYSDPALHYSEHFSIQWRPTATVLGDLTLAGLIRLFDPIVAVKAYFVVFAAGLWLAGRFYFQRLGRPVHAVVLVLALLHSFFVFSGFLPFIGTIALYPLLLGVLVGYKPGFTKSVTLALVLLALFGFHVVGAAVGSFSVFLFSVDIRRKSFCWPEVLAIGPVAALLVYFKATKPPGTNTLYFHGPLGQIKAYIGYNVWTLSRTAGWVALLLLAGLAGLALWDALGARLAHPRLLALAAVLAAIGLVMPYQIGDVFIVGSRTLPFALIAAAGALEWNAARLRWAAAVICAFLALSSFLNTGKALAVQNSYRVFLSGLQAVKPGSRVLPIIEDISQGGNEYIEPFAGVEDLYPIYRGGSDPYVFAEPYVKTGGNLLRLKYRPTYTYKYSQIKPDYRGATHDYDYILCWGELPTIKPVIEKEAPLVFQNGPLSIYGGSRAARTGDGTAGTAGAPQGSPTP